MQSSRKAFFLVASLLTANLAQAQEAAAYSAFFWGAFGGAALLLVALLVWFFIFLGRSAKSESGNEANLGQSEVKSTSRLGE